MHPQQKTFKFSTGVEISSEFDSGNLGSCFQSAENSNSFNCFMSGDGLPYT